jgi:hypothetical protein
VEVEGKVVKLQIWDTAGVKPMPLPFQFSIPTNAGDESDAQS